MMSLQIVNQLSEIQCLKRTLFHGVQLVNSNELCLKTYSDNEIMRKLEEEGKGGKLLT
jgi:hypothetical protein